MGIQIVSDLIETRHEILGAGEDREQDEIAGQHKSDKAEPAPETTAPE